MLCSLTGDMQRGLASTSDVCRGRRRGERARQQAAAIAGVGGRVYTHFQLAKPK